LTTEVQRAELVGELTLYFLPWEILFFLRQIIYTGFIYIFEYFAHIRSLIRLLSVFLSFDFQASKIISLMTLIFRFLFS